MSTVVHFVNTRKDGSIAPLCALRKPRYQAQTTSNQNEVSCSKCAKALGIEAVKKPVSSTRGTCQCCFGSYETRQNSNTGKWTMVNHGYTRPGIGWIVGGCRGAGQEPYELSCEWTARWSAELAQIQEGKKAYLQLLRTDAVPVLFAQVSTGKYVSDPLSRRGGQVMEKKTVEVKLGDKEGPNPFADSLAYGKVPSYETLRNRQIDTIESEIRSIDLAREELTKRVADWTLQIFPRA